MSINQFDEHLPIIHVVTIVTAMGTGKLTLATPPYQGERVDDILLSNTDAIAHVVNLSYSRSGTNYPLASISVPAGSGSAGVPPVNLADTQSPSKHLGWLLQAPDTLAVNVEVAMGAATTLYVVSQGGSF
jgi:hypothetical protein